MNEVIEQLAQAAELAEEEWLRREGDAQDGLQEHNDVPLRIAVARAAIQALPVLHVEPLGWDVKLQEDGSWKRVR